jgi:proteasome lid subunit RPN8/RPN11
MQKFTISFAQWSKLILGLRKRSRGIRESGAFLLTKPESGRIDRIVFYDQFDKAVSDTGIIQFKGGYDFYIYLENNALQVFADIHTHPTEATNQSWSDRNHPMIRNKGHIAIIAPEYADNIFLTLNDCSFYRYKGEFKWEKFPKSSLPLTLLKLKNRGTNT